MPAATRTLTAICLAAVISITYAQFGGEPFFAVGGGYRDGRMSSGERSFRPVLKRHDAPKAFESMVHSSSTVRQLYGLLGLHLTDRAAFEREYPAFSHRRDLVHTMSGCSGFDEEVGQVAKRIASGMYDPLIARSPW
jgi:hypothetical protein